MRADELIKQNEPLLKSDSVKRWYWYNADLKETLTQVHRQSNKNSSEDFKNSEIILQDFIRRYTDETLALPLSPQNSRIGNGSI